MALLFGALNTGATNMVIETGIPFDLLVVIIALACCSLPRPASSARSGGSAGRDHGMGSLVRMIHHERLPDTPSSEVRTATRRQRPADAGDGRRAGAVRDRRTR
ncbi:MAG: hypothetical protein M5T61_10265, partial [Acidimicrobiia bacterium]|nr:hypothetical protein [Acidimicrobiia bacterium]